MNHNLMVITRREAHSRGLKRYYTGERCIRGHDCERFVANGGCIQCATFTTPSKPKVRIANNQGWPPRIITFDGLDFQPLPEEIAAAFIFAEANGWLSEALRKVHADPKLLAQYGTMPTNEERWRAFALLERAREIDERLKQSLEEPKND